MPFDDDENPLRVEGASCGDDALDAEDGMEEGLPDYKLFSSMFQKKGVSSKTIRKGEKDFESHGTRAQDGALEASRSALEEVLGYTRTHRAEAWIRAWYFPDWWAEHPSAVEEGAGHDLRLRERVVVVEQEKGSWMKDIGRTVSGSKEHPGVGRLWLLPEEALYLVERGTIDLWWPDRPLEEVLPVDGGTSRTGYGHDDYDVGLPLSLEAAYCLLVGHDGERGKISLPKLQVYSHLKRAGFHVLRAPWAALPPSPCQEAPSSTSAPFQGLWQWLFAFVRQGTRPPVANLSGPLVAPGIYRAYGPIYQQLAILPRHRPKPAWPTSGPSGNEQEEPFCVFFHVWKPAGVPFSKKKPPAPDFRIAVADTDNSHVPTLGQVDTLLASTPWCPAAETMQGHGRLYQRLKHGYRNVLVAVVDRGLVNFIRFAEGAFGEERLFERFDGGKTVGRGGKRGGRGGGRGRGRGTGRGRGRGRGGG
ncbi:hypothetical protein RJ55_03968 [Drechmeria coniospora]|nr:hypothetical protein RJ55_03968 [Drechmeria coniospora]